MEEKILVVDDDPEIVRLISAYLLEEGFKVTTSHDGHGAMDAIRVNQPDLVVLDLMLPKASGFDLTRTIRADQTLKAIPIIMLTARLDETDKILGLELGADDYVNKPFNPRELVARIRAVLRRTKTTQAASTQERPPRSLKCGDLYMDQDRMQVQVQNKEVNLTKTEYAILETLLSNIGFTLSRDELLERALGYSYEGMGRTLDTHIRNIRRKIEPNPDEPHYIETVHGIGYRMRKPRNLP